MKTQSEETKHTKTVEPQQKKELKTDLPLSEKDEVKKAETRTRKELRHYL